MNKLAGAMVDLSKEVAGMLWKDALQTEGLVDRAFQQKPHLREALGGYKLEVKVIGDNAVLLLCTADGKRALIEDVTCTAMPDIKAWAEGKPCAFTLGEQEIKATCPLPQAE